MGEVLSVDISKWLADRLYTALGPENRSDEYTINAVYRTDHDGPTEWREQRNTYAPPFVQIRSGPIDQKTTQIVKARLQQERNYLYTIILVAAGPPEEAEEAAKIITDRAYNALREMAVAIYDLPPSESGEHVDGLQIGRIRPATFPETDGIAYAIGYIPITIQTETGL